MFNLKSNKTVHDYFLEELEKISYSILSPPKKMPVKGAKGFNRRGIATVTKPIPVKQIAPRVITGKMQKSFVRAEKKAPFGKKMQWGMPAKNMGILKIKKPRKSRRRR